MPFISDLSVRQVNGSHTWILTEDLIYDGFHASFVVPAGFQTDFASIPRWLNWLIPKYGKRYNKAAVLHDHLCIEARGGRFSRRDADGLFRRCLREASVIYWRRRLMWIGVRWGGRLSGATPLDLLAIIPTSILVVYVLGLGAWWSGSGIWQGAADLAARF
jgi:hypothetical protein